MAKNVFIMRFGNTDQFVFRVYYDRNPRITAILGTKIFVGAAFK